MIRNNVLKENLKSFPYQEKSRLSLFRTLWEYFKAAFGFEITPTVDFPFSEKEVKSYHEYTKSSECVDAQTATDLELNFYSETFFENISIIGQQIIHAKIRENSSDNEIFYERGIIEGLHANSDQIKAELVGKFLPLRQAQVEITPLLYEASSMPILPCSKYIWLIQTFSILFFLLTITSWFFVLPFILVFLLIVYLQVKSYQIVSNFDSSARAIIELIKVNDNLCKFLKKENIYLGEYFLSLNPDLNIVRRSIESSVFFRFLLFLKEYADWFFLNNISKYCRGREKIIECSISLKSAHSEIGRAEMLISLSHHLSQVDFCWADRQHDKKLSFLNIKSPFIHSATPLSITSDKSSIFLTGENGVGKSTLLRTIGLNIVLARSFGFCYAEKAIIKPIPVMSSIRVDDSWRLGNSLYVAELKRAKEMLEFSSLSKSCYFLIDEIFRGTNHIDSVSASTAVLNQLSQKGIVVVSSHNLILGALLQEYFSPLKIIRSKNDIKNLLIFPGILEKTNGVSLLKDYFLDPAVSIDANRIADWLTNYFVHPNISPPVLSRTAN